MKFALLGALVTQRIANKSSFFMSTTAASAAMTSSSLKAKPFAVIVQAEVKMERMDEFLTMIAFNAAETRKEPGCLRFDVLRDQSQENKFFFYELYSGPEAIDHHKAQPHYAMWADFKESGGVISSVSHKTDGEFLS